LLTWDVVSPLLFASFSFHRSASHLSLLLTAIVGDITPSDGIPKAEKSRREQEALDEMCEVLGGGPTGMSLLGT
jgi:hypothetical protein